MRPQRHRTPRFSTAPRIRAGLLTSRNMDFAGVADVEALMAEEGLTPAPITAEGRVVERVVGPAHATVTVLPTATAADVASGALAGIVVPASAEFSAADAAWIAEHGFDHVRIPIDGRILIGLEGKLIHELLEPLDQALAWCEMQGITLSQTNRLDRYFTCEKQENGGAVFYRRGADVVLNGHEHNYERFARLSARGRSRPRCARATVRRVRAVGAGC